MSSLGRVVTQVPVEDLEFIWPQVKAQLEKALSLLLPFDQSPHNLPYIAECYRQLGQTAKADDIQRRLQGKP